MGATHTPVSAAPLSIAAMRAELRSLRYGGAPMKARAALLAKIDAAGREQGPELPETTPRKVCCPRAVVSFGCTCSYVTCCPDHGKQCHGSHD